MKKIPASEYSRFINTAQHIPFCKVYPLSVAEGTQSGCIYANESESLILIRHRGNFTFMSGTPNEAELREIHELILSEKLKFLCQDNSLAEKLMQYGDVELVPRDVYSYPHDKAPVINIPDGYTMRRIDEELFNKLTGIVIPSYYWKDYDEYRRNGIGICIMHGSEPASWAFSAASSSSECDIGIETAEAYRKHGLALAAAAAVIKEILPEKRPAWTCQRTNLGSARTAEKLGFVKCSDCILIRKPL
ncbi:GNAT family N-acetyltransferase [Ruminococcus flavefaciens]|uniref:GNAT acetyltransferase n=1 Tax=Ruminococcus flavefaciens TaxID=1265 RepID=A0A1M7MLY1_RUMFL|nr:GNAT family N-acetyltransferase [Ruminococcus flavefaciens]SHM91866.1 GNAT acetyltransferase [Ruminococcus flavefaciens]